MNTRFAMPVLLPALFFAAATQQSQEPKPAPAQPEVTAVFDDEKDAKDKPRKFTLTGEQIKSLSSDPALAGATGMRIINGALYHVVGSQLIPLPGGGASGCFDADGEATRAKIAAAKLELIKQVTTGEPKALEQK